ncbi:MAG: DUF5005 domain-containing protein [Saprospiraceae bacterium]|nr:DUF5005 domain-containing protein [Saprospiraceae bacterium]
MKKLLKMLCLGVFMFSCAEDDITPLENNRRATEDNAIYRVANPNSDAFCDFKLLENEGRCWNGDLTVYEDCHYNLLFTRYGNGWTGSDASYSVSISSDKILWMFGDTFLGTVRADRTRNPTGLVRNTLVLQEGDLLTTYHSGPISNPRAFISPQEPDEWYWPLDATTFENEIHWMLGRLGNTGEGGNWSFEYRGFDLAILNTSDLTIKTVSTKIDDPDISFGSCLVEDEDYTYLYGISTRPLQKRAHLARVQGRNLTQPWSFYDGANWIDTPSDYVIAKAVSDQFSVLKDGGQYYLITHEIIFGDRIFIAESDTPTGPFLNRRILYCTPETSGNIFTYNTFAHPEIATEGELRLSYNINSFDFSDLFKNADLYRPKFIRIDNWK